jgi:nicotinate-nucleotide pyrophosphorylase (carboxylating)
MKLDLKKIEKIIENALDEDIGKGDVTSRITLPYGAEIKAKFVTREDCIACGIPVLEAIFARKDGFVTYQPEIIEGSKLSKGSAIFSVEGSARVILAYERVALNLLQYMCGIATQTRKYVELIEGSTSKILDTRKTTPNLRVLAKYAVWIGGGANHRFCLDDGILIKDNHISIIGSIEEAIAKAKQNKPEHLPIEVECDTLSQVEKAVNAGVDIILLDNMSPDQIRKAVEINKGRCKLEASGGINLKSLKSYAETGVDYISIGALTHSARSIDIGLDIEKN